MTKRSSIRLIGAAVGFMVAALAGPPLICHPINIGNARSLPWRNSNGWDGVDPSYKPVATLTSDTLDLLAPSTPLKVRMETIRRAAIYAARYDRLGDEITSRLLARVASSETSGKSDPLAWFDAGYFVETVRQATFVYKFDMLSEAERNQWKMRGEALALDGKPWIEKAIRLGGQGMEGALANVNEYRQADLKRAAQVPR